MYVFDPAVMNFLLTHVQSIPCCLITFREITQQEEEGRRSGVTDSSASTSVNFITVAKPALTPILVVPLPTIAIAVTSLHPNTPLPSPYTQSLLDPVTVTRDA